MTIEELLQTTSRTFALSIPLLPSPIDRKVMLAYLVFRISDTLEDADHLDRADRQEGLESFCRVLDGLGDEAVDEWTRHWSNLSISDNAHYNRLIEETPQVLSAVGALDVPSRDAIVHHAQRSARGMAEFLGQADQRAHLQLATLDDLRKYCYFVAGIVGELITDLFIIDQETLARTSQLRDHSAAFGEALQLVNILKDVTDDQQCGRAYLPEHVPIEDVFELAFDDLRHANSYVEALREMQAPPGYIAFCDAPVQLAQATLRVVQEQGPGSKVPREEMYALLQGVMQRAGLSSTIGR